MFMIYSFSHSFSSNKQMVEDQEENTFWTNENKEETTRKDTSWILSMLRSSTSSDQPFSE
jgi:hypothetical protein